ncbi:translational GTPase TypA, partial [Candidatus Woesebacteria bacterium]|nr:translational GTPase TypA [Candidatus Woesebacteria bacterium]
DLKIIVVVNKIDKPFARTQVVLGKVEDLFLELAHNEDQLHFTTLYAVAREGKVFNELPEDFNQPGNVTPLLETIITEIPEPPVTQDGPFKMVVSSLDYDKHLGRISIGRIHSGTIRKRDTIIVTDKPTKSYSVERIMLGRGLDRYEAETAAAGDIVALTGVSDITIGQTLSDPSDTESLHTIEISEPTLHMQMGSNTSPFSAQEGEFNTSRQLEERLDRELESNLSLRVEKLDGGQFKLSGRGELHLSILLENMRREGYEMEVGKPQVITKKIDGVLHEPVEEVSIIVPEEYSGAINQEVGKRYGEMQKIESVTDTEVEFTYKMASRALIGLRSSLLTQTKGTALVSSQFLAFEPMGRAIPQLRNGALISSETGDVTAYGLNAAQQRGITFVEPGDTIYEGQIIGLNAKKEDIEVNVCKGKKLTNMRASGSDGVIQITPPILMSLEQSLEFIEDDELLEITPKSLRVRKKQLTAVDRKRQRRKEREAISPRS